MITESEIIAEWQAMLEMFKAINHKSETAKQEYAELKELAQHSAKLTPRQKEGIYARCNNAINGTYSFGDMGYKQNNYDKNRSENKK